MLPGNRLAHVESEHRSCCYRPGLDAPRLDEPVVFGCRSQAIGLELAGDVLRGVILVDGSATAAMQRGSCKIFQIAADARGADGSRSRIAGLPCGRQC